VTTASRKLADLRRYGAKARPLAALLALCISLSCTPKEDSNTVPPPQPSGGWPGAHGLSGVNGDPIINRESVEAFCAWRGRECPIAHGYTDRRDWESMTRRNDWLYDNFAGYRGTLVISQGLVPEGRNQDLAACAAGAFDSHWRDFAKQMVERGRASSILRLGWEFNGDFMAWAATHTEHWKECYRRAAKLIRGVNPKITLDWTINAHATPTEICDGNSVNCYPGDDVVDIIGLDNYDMGPSVSSEEEFLQVAELPDGLTWVYAFAKQRGKKMSVGEWGIAPISKYNKSGENPEFIRWMHNWLSKRAHDIAYEMYFTSCDGSVGSNLRIPEGAGCRRYNPKAAALYKALFGGPGVAQPRTTPEAAAAPAQDHIPPTRDLAPTVGETKLPPGN
jgi:hypothetical protein